MLNLYVPRSSPVHAQDARVKIILTLAFIIALNLTPTGAWPTYIFFLTISLSMALLSQIGIGLLLKRAFIALPLILGVLPLIFSGLPPHLPIDLPLALTIFYSPLGLQRFVSIIIKSWISVQAAILLTASLPMSDLLPALQQLKLPAIWVAIIGMMWRYLFLISDEVQRMLRARSSRSGAVSSRRRQGGSLRWRAQVTGNMAGNLLVRSIERSERVHAAMLARGYNGQLPSGSSQALSRSARSILWIGLMVLFSLTFLTIFVMGSL